MKVKFLLASFVVLLFFNAAVVVTHAKQLDPDKPPDLQYTLVDSADKEVFAPLNAIFKTGEPDKIICGGHCEKWEMYFEPGSYDLIVGDLHLPALDIKEEEMLRKKITYDGPQLPNDANFLFTMLDDKGKETSSFWYILYDQNDPKKVFFFGMPEQKKAFKLPAGTYAVNAGFSRKLKVKNIVIEDGALTEKVIMMPKETQKEYSEEPLVSINYGKTYRQAVSKVFRAIENAMGKGNNKAILAFTGPVAKGESLKSELDDLHNKKFKFKLKNPMFVEKPGSNNSVAVTANAVFNKSKKNMEVFFIFTKNDDEWFITYTNFIDVFKP